MTLTELGSPDELSTFVSSNNVCLVTFSAHWCGPCRASKPQLEALAKDAPIPFGYVYESDLGDFLHTFSIRAFPTYLCFSAGKEVDRVEGVNFAGIQEMVSKHASGSGGSSSSMPATGGATIGGGVAVSPEEARRLRLAKLGGGSAPAPAPQAAAVEDTKPKAMDVSSPDKKEDAAPPAADKKDEDTPMADASADGETPAAEAAAKPANPVDSLDPEAIKTLTESMGFSLLRAQKGLLFGNGTTVETAVEWLMEHQDDDDIDYPIPEGTVKAQSYKCNECGKVLSNMANLELHANKTGHSDFEESTQSVKPLTAEEKIAKIAEIKELLKAKRAEREEAEKVDHIEREKQRRFMGKEMLKTKEQLDAEQRKREAAARKREKAEFAKERARIRAELEKDKRERAANKGKLKTKLGVEGYNPDAIQYDQEVDNGGNAAADKDSESKEPATKTSKTSHAADVTKIDDYIKKVSSYRAGGDGGKCLKILKIYVGNLADNPTEEKFQSINMDNKAFKTKVKPFIGAKHLLLAVGFAPKENDPTHLEFQGNASDHQQLLLQTKDKLEKALIAFG